VANFVNVDAVMDAVDRLVGAVNYGDVAVETNADRVVQEVSSVADAAVTNVTECVVQMANDVLVLAFDVVATAIVFENVNVAIDIVYMASIELYSAIQTSYRRG